MNDRPIRGGAADRLAARLIDGLAVTARRIDVAGVSTALLEGGTGPPVVLLHGEGGFAEMLATTIGDLVDRHRVIAPDLPGLGRSHLTGASLDGAAVVRWLDAVIAETCTEPPPLVGTSLGGSVALSFAAIGRRQLSGLVVAGSPTLGRPRPTPAVWLARRRFRRAPDRSRADRLAGHLLNDVARVQADLGSRYNALQDYLVERARQPSVRRADTALRRTFGSAQVSEQELRRLPVPVALIWGRDDRVTPIEHAERASRRLGWPLIVIDDAGHLPHIEQPAAFTAAVYTVLDMSNETSNHKETR